MASYTTAYLRHVLPPLAWVGGDVVHELLILLPVMLPRLVVVLRTSL